MTISFDSHRSNMHILLTVRMRRTEGASVRELEKLFSVIEITSALGFQYVVDAYADEYWD